jgi:hypothetical protein
MERKGKLPGRTGDSMRNFIKTQIKFGVGPYLEHWI